ncbi:sulfite exporter TauE/SafE family protein [Roseovarius sp. SCSIO 43702]|uniref:sulfite exporter TauE/SafE family protein n=1 Tax=Roseovarius sp. SCSIO 43702 TaxID=2823043 RepID=UPI001C72EEFC|nr:sulfite exporter TauE/SafE family protein [Roseovarius sp. SCSIO 43702]QYX57900.1 sulfite exporter TauE/SafE family protein [Roseovarius sp. SCSIO 43702]
MPDGLLQTFQTNGIWWLILTMSVAGIVRGFTGFGTALIFVPVAGLFLGPAQVVGTITMTGIASTIALLPKAWRHSDRGEVGLLLLAALPMVPAGLWLMQAMEATAVRWVVSVIAGGTLLALVSGWRYTMKVGLLGAVAIGAAAGLIGGMTGLTGPVVILFYLAGQSMVQSVRANTILFLAGLDIVIVANLFLTGGVETRIVWLALVLAVPYFITTMIGQALFDPAREKSYRLLAFTLIGLAVLGGLPIWQG